MEPVSGFVALVGLLATWKNERRAQTKDDFLVWLKEHKFEDVVRLLEQNQEFMRRVEEAVNETDQKIDVIKAMMEEALDILRKPDGDQNKIVLRNHSDQAIEILKEMVKNGVHEIALIKSIGDQQLQSFKGNRYTFNINEPEHLEEDLEKLSVDGYLRHRIGSNTGSDFYSISREGKELIKD